MSEKQGILKRLEHYADCIEKGVHVTGSQLKRLVLDIREKGGVADAPQPAAEIEALRVRADAMAREAIKHEARAERLAEALRECIALGHPRDPAIIAARAALQGHDQGGGDGNS